MTPEDIARGTFVFTLLQTIAVLGQTFLGAAAIYLASKEVSKWRTEILGSKKIDLAIQLIVAVRKINAGFERARSPFGYGGSENSSESASSNSPKATTDYDFNKRLEILQTSIEPIYEVREQWIDETERDFIVEHIKRYNGKFAEIRTAMFRLNKGDHQDKWYEILYGEYEGVDKFKTELEKISVSLLDLAHKYTEEKPHN